MGCGLRKKREVEHIGIVERYPIHSIPTWAQAPKGVSQDTLAFDFWPHGNKHMSVWHGAAEKVQADEEAVVCGECDSEEEVRARMIARKPYVPTQAQVDAQFPMHGDLWSWCKYCLEGKASNRQHEKGNQDDEPLGATVRVDSCVWKPE